MTEQQNHTWTALMADAAVCVAFARQFPEDRRHWLGAASRDMDAAHAVRVNAAIERAERAPIVDDADVFLFGR